MDARQELTELLLAESKKNLVDIINGLIDKGFRNPTQIRLAIMTTYKAARLFKK